MLLPFSFTLCCRKDTAYIEVKDAEALNEEFKQQGIEFMKQLTDEPWGMREFGIKTIDGHRMMFGEDLDR